MLTKTRGLDNAEAKFNEVSMDERGKFESETFSNFGGRRSSSVHRAGGDGLNELIVVTIIAAIDGAPLLRGVACAPMSAHRAILNKRRSVIWQATL